MSILSHLMDVSRDKGAGFLTLIDPNEQPRNKLVESAQHAEIGGADAILIGGSLVLPGRMESLAREIKQRVSIPLLIFPGSADQLCRHADAVLFTSLMSGRNSEFLIGEQVRGAPLVKEYGLEAIPTAYLLIESGRQTSVEYFSHTHPIPRTKPDILKAHVLAAQYLGMKMIYLEAGSGAVYSVPEEMIEAAAECVSLPIICGGGIRNPESARRKVKAGAKFVVIGNRFEESNHLNLFMEFAEAIHHRVSETVEKTNDRP
jgi:phosphoglycerol geranylgeranyltransferase